MFHTKFVEKIKTHFMFNFLPLPPQILPFSEIMWKNMVRPYSPQMTVLLMRIACWIPKATDGHLEYVILIAFLLQTMAVRTCLNLTLYVHWLSC